LSKILDNNGDRGLPYAKKSIMQSNPLKPRIYDIFNTI
jgi:hypothetical protein